MHDHVMNSEHLPIIRERQKVVELSVVYFLVYFGHTYQCVCFLFFFEEPPTKLDAYTVFHTHRIATIFTCCLLDDSLYLPMYSAGMHSHFSF